MKKILANAMFIIPFSVLSSENLVSNGSFENHSVLTGTWALLDEIEGWSTEGAKLEIQKTTINFIDSQSGDSHIELDSTGNYSIYQNIPTVIGKRYKVSFYYSARVVADNSTNRARASFGDTTLTTMNATTLGWKKYEYSVIATDNVTQIKFQGLGRSDSLGALLDNVVVTEEEEVTPPEPPVTCKVGVYGINNFGEDNNSYVYKF
ncbi:DUF642 domain-containing protein, partial [Pseudoalteromonas sp. S2755]|uniref:DUF642 domain-containing protein n=1 Tax=Pseudoalteromonas sp. S2755 TaxID=2066523 RepID=UPI00110B08E3